MVYNYFCLQKRLLLIFLQVLRQYIYTYRRKGDNYCMYFYCNVYFASVLKTKFILKNPHVIENFKVLLFAFTVWSKKAGKLLVLQENIHFKNNSELFPTIYFCTSAWFLSLSLSLSLSLPFLNIHIVLFISSCSSSYRLQFQISVEEMTPH